MDVTDDQKLRDYEMALKEIAKGNPSKWASSMYRFKASSVLKKYRVIPYDKYDVIPPGAML